MEREGSGVGAIYYIPAFLAGPVARWPRLLDHARKMGFDRICVASVVASNSGDLFLPDDFEKADSRWGTTSSAEKLIAEIAATATRAGLETFLDVVLDPVAADGAIARAHPDLYRRPDATHSTIDPRREPSERNAAFARFDDKDATTALARHWADRLVAWRKAGAHGFRLLSLDRAPPDFVTNLVRDVRVKAGECRFLAWTPGVDRGRVKQLSQAGLDGTFSSLPWWNGRSTWYVEEHELLRQVAPVLAPLEAPFGRRLAMRTGHDRGLLYRKVLGIAANTAGGLIMPMGFEAMASRVLTRFSAPEDPDEIVNGADAGLCAEITRAIGSLNTATKDEMRVLASPSSRVNALHMVNRKTAVLINNDLVSARTCTITDTPLAAGEVRAVPFNDRPPITIRRRPVKDVLAAPRIVVENLSPKVEGGGFPARRIVGQRVTVEADAYMDGHDVLAVELLWKAADDKDWQRQPMTALVNDRWQGFFTPNRIGFWQFAVEAWLDEYATLCRAIRLKQDAGVDIAVELAEVKHALEEAIERRTCTRGKLHDTLAVLAKGDKAKSVEALISPETRAVVAAADTRPFAARSEPVILEVERREAAFASWYELFPRSITDDPKRHGTFKDVIGALPRVRDMGFDVLYFPPIHPIGTKARKGKNNSLAAAPGDVGSPYAIGGRKGGHDAIHPDLGTIEDFRRLVAAAREHGLEIALDFAIQCSPDHPWLKQHPDWFKHRPDGTIKYAENPPKKYEDIVNVDFYAEGARPALWEALRDVVLFWIGEGVKIFRVDNPHTKPLPFWQWMIADIRARHPDVLFLAEAFTRPKMMYRLAKVGFSQSYTYFTWRNTRQELTEYLIELTTTGVAEYFRPNFFVNTPDINPVFLQSSGRAGFLIRAVLAATLSGLWGVYSGFEVCEAAPLPGREEYLDSEKYEIRVRDFDAPGNIVSEITALNRIRRAHPALQSHLGVTFYPSSNDQVMVYGKALASHDDMIFVALSLDPHNVQETSYEIPLWEWNLPDNAALQAEDLMHGNRFTLHGKRHWLRLDPGAHPFAIWRLAPDLGDDA